VATVGSPPGTLSRQAERVLHLLARQIEQQPYTTRFRPMLCPRLRTGPCRPVQDAMGAVKVEEEAFRRGRRGSLRDDVGLSAGDS
jgi:hypothetical protein